MIDYLKNSGRIRTQKDLAAALGMPDSTISSAKRGEGASTPLLNRINDAYGRPFSIEWIMTGKGNMLRQSVGGDLSIDLSMHHNATEGGMVVENCDAQMSALKNENESLREQVRKLEVQNTRLEARCDELLHILSTHIASK